MNNFNTEWLWAISEILNHGHDVAPRGRLTKEIPQRTMVVNMRAPVLTVAERKLSYQFMAAEAFWILSGDNRVETIAPYNKRISEFSDDGVVFAGAYGPKVLDQLAYVIEALIKDRDTRQAGMTIWREKPQPSKDIPCTVALFFSIRGDQLNCHTFMRSSDVWLGVPYDVFNFSMLSHLICGALYHSYRLTPGTLYLTAASSHLYQVNFDAASQCLENHRVIQPVPTPQPLFEHPPELMATLKALRDTKPGHPLRWWEQCDET